MRTISFSVMQDKLLRQIKCQTIRLPRVTPLSVGEQLQVYWKQRSPDGHRMGVIEILSIDTKPFNAITTPEFIADGFPTMIYAHIWFKEHYPTLTGSTLFDVIKFKWVPDRESSQ